MDPEESVDRLEREEWRRSWEHLRVDGTVEESSVVMVMGMEFESAVTSMTATDMSASSRVDTPFCCAWSVVIGTVKVDGTGETGNSDKGDGTVDAVDTVDVAVDGAVDGTDVAGDGTVVAVDVAVDGTDVEVDVAVDGTDVAVDGAVDGIDGTEDIVDGG